MQPLEGLSACPQCDAIWSTPHIAENEHYRCGRCGAVIDRVDTGSLESALAASIATLVLLVAALSFPFLTVERSGLSNRISVIDAVGSLWGAGMPFIAAASFLFIVAAPVAQAALSIIVLMTARRAEPSAGPAKRLFRLLRMVQPWAMAEIFLIGVVVSLVKVGKLADVSTGPAFWAMCGLVLTVTFAQASRCDITTWSRLRS